MLLNPGMLATGHKQRRLLAFNGAVELAQIVEGDTRRRQCRQGLLHGSVTQVTQDAKACAPVGNGAQLFLDLLD